jgi:hypothetical protein
MGFNTTVVVMNDALHEIENDSEFGKKLVEAIKQQYGKVNPVDVSAGSHCNAATVIEQHHSETTRIVLIGGNMGTPIDGYFTQYDHTPESQFHMMVSWADSLGYYLRKRKKA